MRTIRIGAMALLCCMACAGPPGERGEAGPPGPAGPAGPQPMVSIDGGLLGDGSVAGPLSLDFSRLDARYAVSVAAPLASTGGTSPTISLSGDGCGTNQILKWSGNAWTCEADLNSGGTVTSVTAGSGLTGGTITSAGTLAIAQDGVTNAMLQNSSISIIAGAGLSGGGPVPLGGTATLSNTGVLAVSAAAPLSVGGTQQNPSLSLSGVVPVSSGGTGSGTAAGALTNLGAAPASGSSSYIQNQTLASQPASLRIGGTIRLGSESGTTDPPDYPGAGLVIRRIRSITFTTGSVVALAGSVRIERDGSNGGLQVTNTNSATNPRVSCMLMDFAGTLSGRIVTASAAATVPVVADAQNIVMANCQIQYSHPNAALDEGAVVQLARTSFADSLWSGFVTSTSNQ